MASETSPAPPPPFICSDDTDVGRDSEYIYGQGVTLTWNLFSYM